MFSKSESFPVYHLLALFVFLSVVLSQAQAQAQSPITSHHEVTKEQKALVAKAFVEKLNSDDMKGVEALFDLYSFGRRIALKVSPDKEFRKGFLQSFTAPHKKAALINDFFGALKNDKAQYHFNRFVKMEESELPLVRVDVAGGGHDFILLYINQKNKVEDFFMATKGKRSSEALAQASQLMIKPSEGFLPALFSKTVVDKDFVAKFKKISDYRRAGKNEEAYFALRALPEESQRSRLMIDLGILLSQSFSEKEYIYQLGLMDKYFGDDETTAFLLVDFHFYNGDLDKALANVEKTIRFLGADGALLNLKASILVQNNQLEESIVVAKKAIELEPDFMDSYWTLSAIYNLKGDFDKLTETFKQLEVVFDWYIDPEQLKNEPDYQAYVQSESFKRWANQ